MSRRLQVRAQRLERGSPLTEEPSEGLKLALAEAAKLTARATAAQAKDAWNCEDQNDFEEGCALVFASTSG